LAHGIEEAVGPDVADPIPAHGGDPADRPWPDDGFERIVPEAVLVLVRLVKHLGMLPVAVGRHPVQRVMILASCGRSRSGCVCWAGPVWGTAAMRWWAASRSAARTAGL